MDIDQEVKEARLMYATSPKGKLDWVLYLARIEAIKARQAEITVIPCFGGVMKLHQIKEVMPCR